MLLSSLDPDHELSTYQDYDKKRNFYFCLKCEVRYFTFGGVSETDIMDFKKLNNNKEERREI